MLDTNALLERLPVRLRQRLLAQCEPVELRLGQTLARHGERTRCVHFPLQGFASLIADMGQHPGLEVGMVGREGLLGGHTALGARNEPLTVLVQGAGHALSLALPVFLKEVRQSAALRGLVGLYLSVQMAQRAAAAGCLRFHAIGPRLARWLLMSQDRAQSAEFPVTQEALAFMLGVRRVGVTEAASALQRRGLIAYHRGHMVVSNRAGLQAAACSCYASDEALYAAALPALAEPA